MTETVYASLRAFLAVGSFVSAWLMWRKLKRDAANKDISGVTEDEKRRTVELRFGLCAFLFGIGVLFARAWVIESPAGPHLLLAIPVIWVLRPMIATEFSLRRARTKRRKSA